MRLTIEPPLVAWALADRMFAISYRIVQYLWHCGWDVLVSLKGVLEHGLAWLWRTAKVL